MPIIPPVWSWPPAHWPAGGDAPDEIEMPEDNFASVAPADLQAARDERDNPGEMQFPPDSFADVAPADLAAARAEMAAPAEIEMPEDYVGTLPPEAPDHSYYIGYPRIPDEQPAPEAPPKATTEALPAADAISGAGGTPITPLAPGLGIPQATFEQAMAQVPTETKGTPELPDEYLSNQELGAAFASLSPEEQQAKIFDLDERRSDYKRKLIAEAEKKNADDAERELLHMRESRAKADKVLADTDAEAKAEAAKQIDIHRGWGQADTGTKIAGIFSALAGGLVAHKYGGRNSGLEMIDKLIEQDIEAQKFDRNTKLGELARRRASVVDQRTMAADDYIQATRARLAAHDRVLAEIDTLAQNYDPRGTQAIRWGQMRQAVAARREQVMQDARKRTADAYKEQLDFASKELDLKKKQAELAKAQRAAMGGGSGSGSGSAKQSPAEWAALYGDAGRPPRPMDAKEYKEWVATGGKVATKASAEAEGEKKRRENSPEWIAGELGAGDLVNEDGTPVLFRTSESAARIAKKRGAVDNAARLIDQLIAARAKYGWSSDLFKSDEWREAKADMGALIIESKNDAELGALSGPDMGLIEQMLGTTDPTETIDPTPGLKRARMNSINGLNTVIRAEARPGSKPKRYDIKAPNYEKPEETEEDRILARAQEENISPYTSFVSDQKNLAPSKRVKRTNEEDAAAYKAAGGENSIPPTIRTQIDKWEADARSGDEAASTKARAYLLKLTETGGSDAIKAAAEIALFAANSTATEAGPRTSTARDGVDIRGRK